MNVRQKILSNLVDRVHHVNFAAATAGLNWDVAGPEFEKMQNEGLFSIQKWVQHGDLQLFRLSHKGLELAQRAINGPVLVVDNVSNF